MKYLVITTRTPAFDPRAIAGHCRFLDDLRAQGMLEQSGPFTDRTGGAYVLRASSFDEAVRLAKRDPLYLQHCSIVSVHEWHAK